jgi:hypothetical protein
VPAPALAPAAGNTLGLLGVSTGLAATLGAVSQVNSDPAVLAQVSRPSRLLAGWAAGGRAGWASWSGFLAGLHTSQHSLSPSSPPQTFHPHHTPPPSPLRADPWVAGHWWRHGCRHSQEDGHYRPAPDGGCWSRGRRFCCVVLCVSTQHSACVDGKAATIMSAACPMWQNLQLWQQALTCCAHMPVCFCAGGRLPLAGRPGCRVRQRLKLHGCG